MRWRDPLLVAFAVLTAWTLLVVVVAFGYVGGSEEAVAGAIAERPLPVSQPPSAQPVEVTIESGMSAQAIVAALVDAGVVDDETRFRVLLEYTGGGEGLQAGRYELPRHLPSVEVIQRLREGQTADVLVAIPEGLRNEEIGEMLAERGLVTIEEWQAALERASESDRPILADRPDDAGLVGYLLPAAYPIGTSMAADDIVDMMLDAFEQQVTSDLIAEAEEQGFTLFEVLAIASVVEREAVIAAEQPMVAAVFRNRLDIGMALQADPTVQFAIATPESVEEWGWWKLDLHIEDLQIDDPYNTYLYPGIPPGPIANPGIAAIRAVVRPEASDNIYFVASDECDGSHLFAATDDEHLSNVARFRASPCGGE